MTRAHETASRSGFRPRYLLRWYQEDSRFGRYGDDEDRGTWYCDPCSSMRRALRAARLLAWDWCEADARSRAGGFGPPSWSAPESGTIFDLEAGAARPFDFAASVRRQRRAADNQIAAEERRDRERERAEAAKGLEAAKARAVRVGVET